ncbi:hypothetical protein ACFQUU_03760 [Herbaspirillum sp. GCM10030257]|uniref:hypothetical protein n=1 Tax=Herbaspirillum sp. GCM10030257 TaxID=3273393 RepID=UPI00360D0B54
MNAIRFTFTYFAASLFACAGHVAMAQQATGEAGAARASETTTTTDTNSVISRFPPGSIQSVESADTALADAEKERSEIEARFTQEKQACMPKFFASSCVDEAKERRRRALLKLRPVEIEANTFKRKARVTSRDEALEKRRQKDADAGNNRDAPSPAPFGTEAVPPVDGDARAGRKPPKKAGVDRAARHDERVRRTAEEERAEEAMRAKKVADYEKKVKAAEARQQELARRKAEKQQKIEERRKLKDDAIQPPGSSSPTSAEPATPNTPATPATSPTPASGKSH